MTESTNTSKAMNKTEITAALADASGIDKKQVATLLEELGKLIGRNLADGGPGVFTVPGLLKISVSRKAAVPEHKGINPFTKLETTFKAKPARNVVKVQALKGLKEMV